LLTVLFCDQLKQKAVEWRSGFGAAALEAVVEYFKAEKYVKAEDIRDYILWAIDSDTYPYRYKEVLHTGRTVRIPAVYSILCFAHQRSDWGDAYALHHQDALGPSRL
jgi:hypothetical protein